MTTNNQALAYNSQLTRIFYLKERLEERGIHTKDIDEEQFQFNRIFKQNS